MSFSTYCATIAGEALTFYGALYDVERQAKDQSLDADQRKALRQEKAVPVADYHKWNGTNYLGGVDLRARLTPFLTLATTFSSAWEPKLRSTALATMVFRLGRSP